MPLSVLPLITLRAAGVVPPMTLKAALSREIPSPALAIADVPELSVPIRLPWMIALPPTVVG